MRYENITYDLEAIRVNDARIVDNIYEIVKRIFNINKNYKINIHDIVRCAQKYDMLYTGKEGVEFFCSAIARNYALMYQYNN